MTPHETFNQAMVDLINQYLLGGVEAGEALTRSQVCFEVLALQLGGADFVLASVMDLRDRVQLLQQNLREASLQPGLQGDPQSPDLLVNHLFPKATIKPGTQVH